jgi:hypothetical protein
VREHRAILQFAFSREIEDPNAMPVTRDLSAGKRQMILNWLALPDLPAGTDRPHRTSTSDTTAIGAAEDDAIDPNDSKGRFARAYLRAAGTVDRSER